MRRSSSSAAGARRDGNAAAGQASVELVALLPVGVLVVLVLLQVLAAGAAREQSGHAAEAGAVALLQHDDAREAASWAIGSGAAHRVRVRVRGDLVTVRVRPVTVLPGLAGRLVSTAQAHAGGGP